jgi:hypothetical protein
VDWRSFGRLMLRCGLNPQKRRQRRLGFELVLSGHHFIRYARNIFENLEAEAVGLQFTHSEFVRQTEGQAAMWIDSVRG